jgi:hypothetical protein
MPSRPLSLPRFLVLSALVACNGSGGRRAVELFPITKNATNGPYVQHQLARIYLIVVEPEQALEQLEPLLKVPYCLSPGWLRIDPTFDPLRSNPRFQMMVN